VWSSGQDQVAVIKRQLQLHMVGVCIFLDVDDLEVIIAQRHRGCSLSRVRVNGAIPHLCPGGRTGIVIL